MIPYSQTALQLAGARTGIAPVNMLDVQTLSGDLHYWADRRITASSVITADGNPASNAYLPWLVSVKDLKFYRSLQTDTGTYVIQNVSGDSLSRDFASIARRSALEGAMFIYRMYAADGQFPWIEVHGTVTVGEVSPTMATLKGSQLLNPSQEDAPLENYSETCQLVWAQPRCGSTQANECLYSYQTCQVPEHIMVVMNDYEKNYGEAFSQLATTNINRRRKI